MAYDLKMGTADLRSRAYDKMVSGVVTKTYKLKQLLSIVRTRAESNFFWREKKDDLTGTTRNSIGGIPRLANFPQATVEWEKIEAIVEKYGLEDIIPWEDTLLDDIPVMQRTSRKLGEAVAKYVDDVIWAALGGNNTTGSQTITSIQSFSIVDRGWDESSAQIVDDIGRARQLIEEKFIPTDNLVCVIPPRMRRAVEKWVTDKGSQFPGLSEATARNGSIKGINGCDFIVSNSAAASTALVLVPKRCARWRQVTPLQTAQVAEDRFKSRTIRTMEMGVTELTDPDAIVAIMGLDSGNNP